MKSALILSLLISLVLPGPLLAAGAMPGCMGMSAMVHERSARGQDAHRHDGGHHDASPAAAMAIQPGDVAGGDCCHGGHAGQCPMASCLNAAITGFVVGVLHFSGSLPAAASVGAVLPPPVSGLFRPPIFA